MKIEETGAQVIDDESLPLNTVCVKRVKLTTMNARACRCPCPKGQIWGLIRKTQSCSEGAWTEAAGYGNYVLGMSVKERDVVKANVKEYDCKDCKDAYYDHPLWPLQGLGGGCTVTY